MLSDACIIGYNLTNQDITIKTSAISFQNNSKIELFYL